MTYSSSCEKRDGDASVSRRGAATAAAGPLKPPEGRRDNGAAARQTQEPAAWKTYRGGHLTSRLRRDTMETTIPAVTQYGVF